MHAQNAAAAYATTMKTTLEPRGVELKAFLRINGRLIAAKDNAKASVAEVAGAIHQNNQLWTILATDVASEGNTLPKPLRAQILSLAIYSQKMGRAILRGEANLSALTDVNSTIIDGLSGKPGNDNDEIEGVA